MATIGTPKFTNDVGASKIEIGVREFECIGARSPFDHPHVYLDMGQDKNIVCPYCSTLFAHNPDLGAEESIPSGCCLTAEKSDA
ncbi:MAG: hypothetical protein DHS20C08_02180 [Rhodomicrobium sp.]|nr:MAG: hypothetical protein DHS20C08_02180 [Rhodomicrobium sp.]